MQPSTVPAPPILWTTGLAWLTLALLAGALGWLTLLPQGGPQILAVLLTVRLPLSLLPTFLVPILVASHILLSRRIAEAGGAGA